MRVPKKIAICGRAGAGKSEVAKFIQRKFGHVYCSSGKVCREVTRLLFGSEQRVQLNQVCLKLREIESTVWVTAALRETGHSPFVVYDGLRFKEDHTKIVALGYFVIRVIAKPMTRLQRLKLRQQVHLLSDEENLTETEQENFQVDLEISNEHETKNQLFQQLETIFDESPGLVNV